MIATSYCRGAIKSGSGVQAGYHSSGRDLTQIVNMSLSKEEHPQQAVRAADGQFPLDTSEFAETDLRCAAHWMAASVNDLRARRKVLWKPLAALAIRLRPVSEELCKAQAPTARAAAGTPNVAFVAAPLILLSWPDTTLSRRYVLDFSQVGLLENPGTMRDLGLSPLDQPPQSVEQVIAKPEELMSQFLRSRHEPEEDEFLHAECLRDLERGTAGPLMSQTGIDSRWGARQVAPATALPDGAGVRLKEANR